jgi:anti-sigma-K factor RskA
MLDLAPLYALDALEGPERLAFESHLPTCPECQKAVDDYQAVAAGLVADEPASELTWQRIRQSIDTNRPIETGPSSGGAATPWRWVAGIAAAAAIVFGAIFAFDLAGVGQLTPDATVAAADDAASEPGAIVGDFLVDDVSVATVVLANDGRGYVIPKDSLAALEDTMTYQLWVINDTEDVISAGVLGNDPAPATFTWTGDVTGFALTREVAGGVVSSAGDVVSVISGV